jgi:ferredoxin
MAAPGDFPEPVADFDRLCIECGHCVAVCPHGALSLEAMPLSACPPVPERPPVTAEAFENYSRSRRSIRRYQPEAVPRDLIARLIRMARYAPSGHNSQPVHWLVLEDRDLLRRLSALVIGWMRAVAVQAPEMRKGSIWT